MFNYELTGQITGTVHQVNFNRKMYDTTGGRYNRGVFICTEPGYYQFTSSMAAESSSTRIAQYMERNGSSVGGGLAK